MINISTSEHKLDTSLCCRMYFLLISKQLNNLVNWTKSLKSEWFLQIIMTNPLSEGLNINEIKDEKRDLALPEKALV